MISSPSTSSVQKGTRVSSSHLGLLTANCSTLCWKDIFYFTFPLFWILNISTFIFTN